MRGTIHVVSRREYWLHAVAVRAAARERGSCGSGRRASGRRPRRPRRTHADALRAALADGPADRQGAGRPGQAGSSATPGCGWTSCASRRRARGSGAGPTGWRSRRLGRARRTRRRRRGAPTSCAPTCARSGRRRGRTSRRGRASARRTSSAAAGVRLDAGDVRGRGGQAARGPARRPAAGSRCAGPGPVPAPLGRADAGRTRGAPGSCPRRIGRSCTTSGTRPRWGPCSSTGGSSRAGGSATGRSRSSRSSRSAARPRCRRGRADRARGILRVARAAR